MYGTRQRLFARLGVACLALALGACPQKPPEVRVLEARSGYFLEPSGILINELETETTEEAVEEEAAEATATAGEAVAVAMAAEAAVAAEEAAEGEELEEESAELRGPRSVEVMFDLLVRFNGTDDALPGITVEVLQRDPFQKEKARHLTWVETPGLRKGEERIVPVRLEVDNYEDGDQFSVEWNPVVPPEKRGEYREFSEAAP